MQLVSFSHETESNRIEGLQLQSLNLIVGRNASGKTRTLNRIEILTEVISDRRKEGWNGKWKVIFQTEIEKLVYTFERGGLKNYILHESLTLGEKVLIERTQSGCFVSSEVTNIKEEFTPPDDKLVIHVRRDKNAHPLFENLIEWASDAYSFRFGSIISGLSSLFMSEKNFSVSGTELPATSFRVGDIYKNLDFPQRENVLDTMNQIGYNLSGLRVQSSGDLTFLVINEAGLETEYADTLLSQGMFRTLVLLTYLQYLIHRFKPQLLTIDDLGEGLDYSRANKLGKFIFEECQKAGIQLIATSNDSFLMNVVPIEYWNVLRRKGNEITALNEKNQPELFKRFAYTGLSNFDFFSSDYIDSRLKTK